MEERSSVGKVAWVNLKNPILEEIHAVMEEFDVPPAFLHDLLTPVPRNYAVEDDGAIKIALDFPVVKRIDVEHPYEVKFIITKRALITIQYEEMEAMDRFKKHFEVATTLGKTKKGLTATHIFFGLMNELYQTSSSKLDYVESCIADIESEIFTDNERQMVVEIAKTNKRLIAYRHTIGTHEDMFFELEPIMLKVYGKTEYAEFLSLRKSYMLLIHRANALFETINAVRTANDSMLNTKQNETIKTLTIMAFITFPLTLFSSMFGMNTEATPIIGHSHDFWIIVGVMCTATIFFFTFFKYKKWM